MAGASAAADIKALLWGVCEGFALALAKAKAWQFISYRLIDFAILKSA